MAASNSQSTSPGNVSTPVPFPQPDALNDSSKGKEHARTSTNASTSSRIRSASIKLMEADPPPGMWAATGSVASKAPSLVDIRRGSFGPDGWDEQKQREHRRGSQGGTERPVNNRRGSSGRLGVEPFPALTEERPSSETRERAPQNDGSNDVRDVKVVQHGVQPTTSRFTDKSDESAARQPLNGESQYANGYMPPPKLPWTQSFMIGLKGFWKWFLTIPGFLITIYALNVVAWGGMLFLLLCNAAPAMCTPTCDDINSPRRKWVEIDSQILNALFCVTGFGLAPWRFRDLYWWALWRLGGAQKKLVGIRRLAGIHRGWFRLPGSEQLPEEADATKVSSEDPAVPIPASRIPDPPPTGFRASPTKSWKMDFVLWMNASNTFFQVLLCFYMWHYNRIERPSWATGLFVALGCIVAGVAGIMMAVEGKRIKKVEGVPMRKEDRDRRADVEAQSAQNVPLVSYPGGVSKA
ncbi:uncharacterized protein M421DRAFT_422343 [Didymella exigua CBS 183.55]|uniref:Uncharacterized protein n=1 Tax=Didymella exigua CBS 183.55 TaxID=1150837 RepID=A0A6A5REQ5_9PLEO|nr:uncharacterized protein M421DRAFT_422343 [Didymella exigua CBS 183.55]KAF1926745.1 hypothetical protein M421DRAFT_422343 [Didymella exigua CBS 183.55]